QLTAHEQVAVAVPLGDEEIARVVDHQETEREQRSDGSEEPAVDRARRDDRRALSPRPFAPSEAPADRRPHSLHRLPSARPSRLSPASFASFASSALRSPLARPPAQLSSARTSAWNAS